MIYKLQDFVIRKGIYIEIAAVIIFLLGVAFHFIPIPNDSFFVIIGGLMLCGLYTIYYFTFQETFNAKSPMDIFISRLLPLTLVMIVFGILSIVTGSKSAIIIKIGLIMLLIVFAFWVYNRIWLKSNFNPGIINFFRIIIIAGIALYMVL